MRRLASLIGLCALVLSSLMAAQTAQTVTTGGGTAGRIPKFSDNTALVDSAITESNGKIGIGTSNPAATLHLYGTSDRIVEVQSTAGNPGIQFANGAGFYTNQLESMNGSLYWWNGSARNMVLTQNGFLGLGTASPSQRLNIGSGSASFDNFGYVSSYRSPANSFTNLFLGGSIVDNGNGSYTVQTDGGSNYFAAVRMDNAGGNAGAINFYTGPSVGTTQYSLTTAQLDSYLRMAIVGGNVNVNGNLRITGSGASLSFADGTTQSTAWTGSLCGGDYAESVDVTGGKTQYEPGDVLVIDPENDSFAKAVTPYSTNVAGIYSTKPGVVGKRSTDEQAKSEVPMAMVGIVPTKVSAENGPIRRGDLLVTSSMAGYAMKGTDRNRIAGAVVGKALGKLDTGIGVIDVLVSLQ